MSDTTNSSETAQRSRSNMADLLELFGDKLPTYANRAMGVGKFTLALATWPQLLGISIGWLLVLGLSLIIQPVYIKWAYITVCTAVAVSATLLIPQLRVKMVDSTAESIGDLISHSSSISKELKAAISTRQAVSKEGVEVPRPGWNVFFGLLMQMRKLLIAGGELVLPLKGGARPWLYVLGGAAAGWLPFVVSALLVKPGWSQLLLQGGASLVISLQCVLLLLVIALGSKAAFILGVAQYLLDKSVVSD